MVAATVAATGTVVAPEEPTALQVAALQSIRACETALAEGAKGRRAGRLHHEIARHCAMSLGEHDAAIAHLRAAVAELGDDRAAIRALRRELTHQQAWDEVVALLQREVRLASDRDDKAALFIALGHALDERSDDPQGALKAYLSALELTPADLGVHSAIEGLLIRLDRPDELDALYDRCAQELSDDPRHRSAVVASRAELSERRRAAPSATSALYAEAARLDVDAAAALTQLRRLRHEHRQWPELVGALKQQLHQLQTKEQRVLLLHRLGKLASDRIGDRETAFQALQRAAIENPRHPLVLAELARHFEDSRQWSSLVEATGRLVEVTTNERERLGLTLRIGQLCEEHLDDREQAVVWYERARGLDPTHVPALQALAKLYATDENWQGMLDLHLGEAEALGEREPDIPQPRRRAAAHARAAELLETRLQRVDDAIDHHLQALAYSPDYTASFKALERLYPMRGRHRDLVMLYEEAIERAPDPDRVRAFLYKIGNIWEDQLNEPERALAVYRRLLQGNPEDIGAIHAMQRAAERAERWRDLVEALTLEATRIDDEGHRASLLHRAGEVADQRLEQVDEAIASFQAALESDPRYVPSLLALGRIYYRLERWEDLLDMYRRELAVTPYGSAAVTLLIKMGELYEERVGDMDAAIECYGDALKIDPSTGPALSILSAKLERRGDYETLVQVVEAGLAAETEPAAVAQTLWRLGTVYEERLDDPDRALEYYRRAVESDEGCQPAYEGIECILQRQGRFDELLTALTAHARSARDVSIRRASLLWASRVAADELDDIATAVALLEPMLDVDPPEPLALRRLEKLYVQLGNLEALADVYDAQADAFTTTAARAGSLKNLARIQLASDEPAKGIATLRTVVKLVPTDAWAAGRLTEHALATSDVQLLTELEARTQANSPVGMEVRIRLGELLEAEDPEQAVAVFRAALRDAPDLLPAARGLARAARTIKQPLALVDGLLAEARCLETGPGAARALVEAARVSIDQLGDKQRAVPLLFDALRADPNSVDAVECLIHNAEDRLALAERLSEVAREASPERATKLWLVVADQLLALEPVPVPSQMAAKRALSRAEALSPADPQVLVRQAQLDALSGRWDEAVERLERVLKLGPPGASESSRPIHLQLGRLYADFLEDDAKALHHVQTVLSEDPADMDALNLMLTVHQRAQRWDDAVDTVVTMLEVATTPERRGYAHLRGSALALRRGDPTLALETLIQGVRLCGASKLEALGLRAWVDSQDEGYPRYIGALQKFVDNAEGQGRPEAESYIELARAQSRSQMTAAAMITLQRGLAACGDHLALRLALSEALAAGGQFEEALTELREFLATRADHVEAWKALNRVFAAARDDVGAFASGEVVALLTDGPPPQALRPPDLVGPQATAGVLSADNQRVATVESPAQLLAGQILGLLAETIRKRHPPQLSRHGVTGKDALPQGAPLKRIADDVGRALGVAEPAVFMSDTLTMSVAEPTSPAAVVLPAGLAEASRAEAVFAIARCLGPLARRLNPVMALSPRDIELLVAAATRLSVRNYGAGLTSESFLEELSKQISQTISRRARKVLDEVGVKHANARRMDYEGWPAAVDRTGIRIAALCANDLAAAVTMIVEGNPQLTGLSGAALLNASPEISALTKFWVSNTALSLRRAQE